MKHRPYSLRLFLFGWLILLAFASGCSQNAPDSTKQPTALAQPALAAAGENLASPEATPLPEPTSTATLAPPIVTVIEANNPAESSIEPTAVALPSATPTETATPTATPFPMTLNGLPLEEVIFMPDNVRANVQAIFERGQEMGRDPNAFSKVGDSTIEKLNFLSKFDEGGYQLGEFDFLQAAIDHYAGSFAREGFSVVRGLHSWSVFDPIWANETDCQADETVIACEFRWHNPSVVLIRLGSNDQATDLFAENLRRIVEYSIENGVVPILATKPDRFEGESDLNNINIRQIAAEYEVPLWDFDLASQTLPGNGLSEDNIHMTTFYSYDYTRSEAFERGHAIQNLTALIALYMMWLQLINS